MLRTNYTAVTEFILLGLTDRVELQPVLFAVFLVVYLITVIGNLHFIIALVITDYYMLAVMAYDRYMAICKPLSYGSKMSRRVCLSLVAANYIYGLANGLAQTILLLRLSFCGPNAINHFYCADPPLMVLACSDTYVKETAMFVVAGANLTCSLTIILISYIFIFSAILRIRSAEGRHKAFSTCGSHLTAVTVFYGTLFCMYLTPPSKASVEQGKIVAVFYTFVSPMLNPLIYSFRNKDVKSAVQAQTQRMPITNGSAITEFILLGLTDCPELQPLLFVLFLVVYLVTLLGNLGMVLVIRLDPRLHTPMYFFLTNLAFVDLCYTSNATPQMLTNLLSERKTITFAGCFAQCYLFIALLLTEFYMLAAMAYDRYVAICSPLHYSVKMSRRVCLCLATFPYVCGFAQCYLFIALLLTDFYLLEAMAYDC
ncbi:olfactory receptor Olr468-like protein [Camelus ferus]|nr:olfactory receptor Olr468-like protein [Camelus ferus]